MLIQSPPITGHPLLDNWLAQLTEQLRYMHQVEADYIELLEVTAPAAPGANRVRIYAQDSGAGKTQLMARFATGAAQELEVEP